MVEALASYAKADLLVPLQDIGDGPGTLEAAHSETMAVPAERQETEPAVRTELPSLGLRIGPAPVLRTVDRLSCIRFASSRYSVPLAFIGSRVEVADHDVVPPGETSVLDEFYPSARPTKCGRSGRRAGRPRTHPRPRTSTRPLTTRVNRVTSGSPGTARDRHRCAEQVSWPCGEQHFRPG